MNTLIVLALTGIVIVAVIAIAYRRDCRAALERVKDGAQILQSPFGKIEFARRGNGPAVLIVHGAGGGFDQALDIGEGLIDNGYEILAPSRFGYLGSDFPKDACPAKQADAFAFLVEALGLQRVIVAGVSAGAPSAIEFAIRHGKLCSGLVLLVPALGAFEGAKASIRIPLLAKLTINCGLRSNFVFWSASKLIRNVLIRTLLATNPALPRSAPPDERARVLRILRHIMPVSHRRIGLLHDAQVVTGASPLSLEEVDTPALAISCEDDLFGTFANARHAAAQIPGGLFLGYSQGGHVLIGRQEDAVREIVAFIKEAEKLASGSTKLKHHRTKRTG